MNNMCTGELRDGTRRKQKLPLDPIYKNGEDELYENKYTTLKDLEAAFWKGEITMEELKRNHLWSEKSKKMSKRFDELTEKMEKGKKIMEELGNTPFFEFFKGEKSNEFQEEKREKVKEIIGDMEPKKGDIDIITFFKRKADEQKKKYKELLYRDSQPMYKVSLTSLDIKNANYNFNLNQVLLDRFMEVFKTYKSGNDSHLVIETLDGHLIFPSYLVNSSIINIKK
jgi:hypothetical protein